MTTLITAAKETKRSRVVVTTSNSDKIFNVPTNTMNQSRPLCYCSH